jgi:hypothetical protein
MGIAIPLRRQHLGAPVVSTWIAFIFPKGTALPHVLITVADARERFRAHPRETMDPFR